MDCINQGRGHERSVLRLSVLRFVGVDAAVGNGFLLIVMWAYSLRIRGAVDVGKAKRLNTANGMFDQSVMASGLLGVKNAFECFRVGGRGSCEGLSLFIQKFFP